MLEDRSAPLYNRTTDEIALGHLDIASLIEILRAHADDTPDRLLFLWTLFEGVPKFYRDCYEQEVLASDRRGLLRRMFFESSSPLRTEADNWFLKEFRGRYDVVLKYIARHGGCTHADLGDHVRQVSPDSSEQVSGYIQVLAEKYKMIEKKLPIFSKPHARKTRYYLSDNFLKAWLAAISSPVSAVNFRPLDQLVEDADHRLCDVEGGSFEKLVATLYEERSRKGVGDFALSQRIDGYWDKAGTEIDLVALNEDAQIIRFGSCKRSADRLLSDITIFEGHVQRFLKANAVYNLWKHERVSLAPTIPDSIRHALQANGLIAQDLNDLVSGL